MATRQSIYARAERVLVGLSVVEEMARNALAADTLAPGDLRALAWEVRRVVDAVQDDALAVVSALRNARVVTFRVIE